MTRNRSSKHNAHATIEDAQFEADLIEAVPFLKSFARTLSRNAEVADDLVQDTLLNAWRARASYKPDTNLKAWLCTILRNKFYSDGRRAWRQMPWDQEAAERIIGHDAAQAGAVELSNTVHAMEFMPAHQREALTLIGAGGFSYREAAAICNVDPGTLKSRVMRARRALTSLLEGRKALPKTSRLSGREAAEALMTELARLALGQGKVGLHSAQGAAFA
ncbi:MAG TPA: sigma-70 family RNA polymerase sigma factor [Micropepsaceae bacterium]|nr:sigma-70 family RNA polymerase sigma factor [Micropepsaceae bacterium]